MEEHRHEPPTRDERPPASDSPGKSSPGMLMLEVAGAIGLAIAVGLLTRYARQASSAPSQPGDPLWHQAALEAISTHPLELAENVEKSRDSEMESRLVGRWKALIHGEQIIEKRTDGTALLDAKLDFAASLLYGPQLRMQLVWRVRDGVLTSEIVEGEPSDKVAALIRDRGRSRSYRILNFDENQLVLRELEGDKERHVWTRLP